LQEVKICASRASRAALASPGIAPAARSLRDATGARLEMPSEQEDFTPVPAAFVQ
jgi:hypothetical protein